MISIEVKLSLDGPAELNYRIAWTQEGELAFSPGNDFRSSFHYSTFNGVNCLFTTLFLPINMYMYLFHASDCLFCKTYFL